MSALVVKNLSKAYGAVRAVDGVSFELASGELLAMIGPNGAGKTTCFNLLNGQIPADGGEVVFHGASLLGLAPREIWRRGVGRTFQVPATFGSMTVRENVQMALLSSRGRFSSLWAVATHFEVENADALLHRVGMLEQSERACAVLAYGDLKRVELAIAIANRPRLLLMDEPTAGMASAERRELMQLAVSLARADGIGVLFTEHDMDVVFGFADRVMVLAEGRLIAAGSPQAVRADPKVREVYLGAMHA